MKCLKNNTTGEVVRTNDLLAHYLVSASSGEFSYCPKHVWRTAGRAYLHPKVSNMPPDMHASIAAYFATKQTPNST